MGIKEKKTDSQCLFEDYSPAFMEFNGKLSISCNMSWTRSSGYHHNEAELKLVVGSGRYKKNISNLLLETRLNCGKAVKFAENNNKSSFMILHVFI